MLRRMIWTTILVLLLGIRSAANAQPAVNRAAGNGGGNGNATLTTTPVATMNPKLTREIEEHLKPLTDVSALYTATGEVMSNEKARALIDQTLATCNGALTPPSDGRCTTLADETAISTWRSIAPVPDAKDFYCLSNVVRWDNRSLQPGEAKRPSDTDVGTVATSHWYVYDSGKT